MFTLRLLLLLSISAVFKASLSTTYVSLGEPWIVACSTQNRSNITWRLASGGELKLNVTQVTNRKSVLYVRLSAALTRLALLREPLQCRARDLTTMQETLINQFEFMIGSKPLLLRQSPSVNQILPEQSIRLFCVIPPDISPHPSVTWIFQRNGSQSELRNSSEDKIVKSERDVSLDVSGKESNGTYFCNISNSFGYVLSSPIAVIVAYLNNITLSINPTSRRVIENNDVKVSAHVDCNPAPFNITLSHDGKLKANVTEKRNLKHNFKAKKSDTGSYGIIALHVLGQVREEFFLLVLSQPSAVKFSIQSVARSSVSYNWTVGLNGNADIKRVVLCCGENVDDVKTYPCSGSATVSQDADLLLSLNTLLGLRPNATSYCELFVFNEVGVTASGDPKVVTTKVPSQLNITSCFSEKETVLNVTWTASNEGNTITQYIIRYKIIGDVNVWSNQTLTDGFGQTGGSKQLAGLKKLSLYLIAIIAKNSVGWSSVGSAECQTTCDLPAPLEQNDMRVTLKSGVSLLLHVDSRCENITGFAAESCDSNKKPPRIKFSPQSSHTFWFNITGLEPGEHCVMIKATGIRVVGKYAVFNITVQSDSDELNTLVIIISITVVVPGSATLIAVAIVCRRKMAAGTYEAPQPQSPTAGASETESPATAQMIMLHQQISKISADEAAPLESKV
ncbi:neuronal cell adhesion molecule-like isoform X2 [Oscarella lobularis]|uniref:neuronal cell adhesion molecule-like isoform X2 n=1 Tax=Oscarella lobularis TaxID=121494 RepID=UPI003313FE2B